MSKRDIIMIAITVILVGVMVAGFIYDRTPALIDRTNPYAFSDDKNLKVIATEKKGITFRRVYYEVKMQILDGYWEQYYTKFDEEYGVPGTLMTNDEFDELSKTSFQTAGIKPVPASDSVVWFSGIEYETYSLIYVTDTEADGNTYFYIYYARK